MQEDKQSFEGSATRSSTKVRADLIPAEGILAIGLRFGEGCVQHGENNWKGGGKEFIKATINHMEQHLQKLKAGIEDEHPVSGHEGAIGWGATALAWYKNRKPEEYAAALADLR